MPPAFDPYYEWLAIPAKDQPPHHYKLLGLDLYEANESVIQRATDRQMTHVRSYQNGPHGPASQRLLNEISAARICLLDGARKAAYDAQLRAKLAPVPAAPPRPPAAPSRSASDTAVSVHSATVSNPPPPQPAPKPAPAASPEGGNFGMLPLVLAVGGGLLAGAVLLGVALWLTSGSKPPAVAQVGKDPKGGPTKPLDKPAKAKPRDVGLPKPGEPLPVPSPKPADPPVAPPASNPPALPPTPVATPTDISAADIPGLVFHAPLDEGMGDAVTDAASGAKGMIVGTAKWAEGKFGKALDLDGSSYVNFGDILDFDKEQAFTMAAWVWIEASKGGGHSLGGRMTLGQPYTGYDIHMDGDQIDINAVHDARSGEQWLHVKGSVPNLRGQWRHVVSRYDGKASAQGLQIFVDGEPLAAERQGALSNSTRTTAPFCLGARGGGECFAGKIDDFRVYNRALTDGEIAALLTPDAGPLGPATPLIPDLAFHVALDEGVGGEAVDAAAGAKGKIVGNPKWVEGKFGKALEFDGGTHIDFGQILDFDGDQAFSISAWVQMEPGAQGTIVAKMNDNPDYSGWGIDVYEGRLIANIISDFRQADARQQVSRPMSFGAEWRHVVWTYDGSRDAKGTKLLIDGKEEAVTVAGASVKGIVKNGWPFLLGARNGKQLFRGKMDDVRVYRRVLSADEIARLLSSRPEDLIQQGRIVQAKFEADGLPVEVLPDVDRAADAVAGTWTGEKELLSTADDKQARIQLPVPLPVGYRLVVVAQRVSPAGSLTLGLPVGRSAAAATFSSSGNVVLHNVEGDARPGKLKMPLDLGQEFVIVCESTPQLLRVRVNGEEALAWEGDPSSLALPAAWRSRSSRFCFLGTENGAFKITRVQIARWQPPPPSEVVERPAPPSEAALKEFVATVKSDFRNQIRNAKTPEARIAVADEMIFKGTGTDEPRLMVALLIQGRDMAADAGGFETAFTAIDRLADRLVVDRWKQKAEAFAEAGRAPAAAARQQQIVRQGVVLAAQAAAAESFAAADAFLETALGLATKLKDTETRTIMLARRDEYRLADKLRQDADEATATLARNPAESKAHEAIGRYRCLAVGDWPGGLLHLAQSSDARLAQAALVERRAATPLARKQAAQEWWRYSATMNGPLKTALQRHVFDLLLAALPTLPPDEQKATAQTIQQICVEAPSLSPRPPRRGLKAWFKADEGVLVQAGRVYQWNDSSGSGNHAKQDKPEFAMTLAPSALGGRPVLRAAEGSAQCLTFTLPDMPSYEGFTAVFVGNTGAIDRGLETILGADGPDIHWILSATREGLGSTDGMTIKLATKGIELERPFVICHRYERKVGWQTTLNGAAAGRAADRAFTVTPQTFCIGCYRANNVNEYPFGGDLAEILLYDHPLSEQDHRTLVVYLSLKYGLHLPPPAVDAG